MKISFTLIIFFYLQICQSQSLENYWELFYSENWNIKIDEEKSNFLGKEIQYKISFINLKGNSKNVNFYVYKKSDIDLDFKNETQKYLMMQSCLFEAGKFNFESFYLNEYYYFLLPCHCNTKNNLDCENLAEKIKRYIIEE